MNFSLEGSKTGVDGESGAEIKGLTERLTQFKDKRERRGMRYPLAVGRVMRVVAKRSGQAEGRGIADGVTGRARLIVETVHCRQQTRPHQPTLSRILNAAVDSAALAAVVNGAVRYSPRNPWINGGLYRGATNP